MSDVSAPTQDTSERVLNPLWIISLFLGLAEVTVGVAATQSQGWIQGLLAIFSVVFPSAVAAVFFVILLTRPFVLYAPRDYPSPPSIEAYVTAVSSTPGRNLQGVEAAIRSAIEEVVVPRLPASTSEHREELIEAAVQAAQADLQRRSVEVDLSRIDRRWPVRLLSFPHDLTVSELLDAVFMELQDRISIYSYGREWLIQDSVTGRCYTGVGYTYREGGEPTPRDDRNLSQIGIDPGARLLAVPIGPGFRL